MDTKEKKRSGGKKPAADAGKRRKGVSVKKEQPPRKHSQSKGAPDVVYTPAKPFVRRRFLLRMATVAAVVAALVFGVSLFFKVETIRVAGAENYSAWDIREASGIQDGENLLTLDKVRSSSMITAALPYVDTVRISIILPDTVLIEVWEWDVVYAVQDESDGWWLMTAAGRVVESTDAQTAEDHTVVEGVRLSAPAVGQQAMAFEERVPEEGEVQTTTASDRLAAALLILDSLESNGVIGQVAGVDVSNLGDLELWYGRQYRVLLGDASRLDYKINYMSDAIEQLEDYQSGVLDVSFTSWPDRAVYTPFD